MKKNIWITILLGLIVIGAIWYLVTNRKSNLQNPVASSTPITQNSSSTILAEESGATSTAPSTNITIPKVERVPSRYACVGEYCDGSMYGDNYKEVFTVLRIPFIRDGGNIGCGVEVFYGYDTATKTPAVMDATYKRLFDIKEWPEIKEDGFRNIVAAFSYLYYDHVTLKEGTVKLYLLGKMTSPGVCADPEFKAQIEAAAFQFSNVKKLEVYLNGKIFDWCSMDLSDGEGPCPENPKYWITNK